MKKLWKILIFSILSVTVITYTYSLIFVSPKIKYDLTNCVRYFDDEGRYRLMYVGDKYFFVDAENEVEQVSNLKEYHYEDNVFYGVSFRNEQSEYSVINLQTGKKETYSDILLLPEATFRVFDSSEMICLNEQNKYERYFRKFIPLRYSKK